jgi:hypothetical protein
MQRREALQTLAALAGVPALAGRSATEVLTRGARFGGSSVLSRRQLATLAALAERIIPATDTPGAREAGVAEFIDVLLTDWFTAGERDEFLAGLADVDARARASFARAFADGTPPEQDRVVAALDDEAYGPRREDRSEPGRFFARFKALTLYGYYNSEVGMTQELRYEIIPHRYEPCAPLGGG